MGFGFARQRDAGCDLLKEKLDMEKEKEREWKIKKLE